MKHLHLSFITLALLIMPMLLLAEAAIDTVAVQGYDVVSYHQSNGVPKKGTGNSVAYYDGEAFLFDSDANKKVFEANPEKYLPAYGGYCAFGVTKSKKFVGDPMAYKVVDGTLYLNLSKEVQKIWLKDVPGNIETANGIWPDIKNVHPTKL